MKYFCFYLRLNDGTKQVYKQGSDYVYAARYL
jgi:hypothetical protein